METQFEADEWSRLEPTGRIRQCRLMADEARSFAASCPSDLKDAYLSIAHEWLNLASEIEKLALQSEQSASH